MKNLNIKTAFSYIVQPNTRSRPWSKGETLPLSLDPFQNALQRTLARG